MPSFIVPIKLSWHAYDKVAQNLKLYSPRSEISLHKDGRSQRTKLPNPRNVRFAMRQYLRLVCFLLLLSLGLANWWILGKGIGKLWNSYWKPSKWDEHRGVMDFLPRFQQPGVVDEAFEARLYASLTELEQTLRSYQPVKNWPKYIWQTSPSKGETEEMNNWKVKNPDWRYKVPRFQFI